MLTVKIGMKDVHTRCTVQCWFLEPPQAGAATFLHRCMTGLHNGWKVLGRMSAVIACAEAFMTGGAGLDAVFTSARAMTAMLIKHIGL